MAINGTVRFWLVDEGWGVIDSSETPGGCWAHFGEVAVAGYSSLQTGQPVVFEWERFCQDGYAYRAVRIWPADQSPVDTVANEAGMTAAYGSALTIMYDDLPSEDPR